jgi:hypothetical protein
MKENSRDPNKKWNFDIKKDISKTFKRMLTSNHNRSNNGSAKMVQEADQVDPTIESTKYARSIQKDEESEIEKKFKQKNNKWKSNINKIYKEDEMEENYMEKNYSEPVENPLVKHKREDVRML